MKTWRKPFDLEAKAVKPPKTSVSKERCKGCGYCVAFCPRGVLEMSGELSSKGYDTVRVADQSKCLGCGLCEVICPEVGIHLAPGESAVQTATGTKESR